jgi:hypothetical protein
MEYYRKQAKALVRGFRAGEREAVERAEAVLGERARARFRRSDAQHVVAREAGHRSWPELVRATDVDERTLEPGPAYDDAEPVIVRVRRRGHRYTIDDAGAAVARAGRPRGWLEVAGEVVEAFALNVNRRGVVFVPAVEGGVDRAWLAGRVADCSAAVYEALLELDDE